MDNVQLWLQSLNMKALLQRVGPSREGTVRLPTQIIHEDLWQIRVYHCLVNIEFILAGGLEQYVMPVGWQIAGDFDGSLRSRRYNRGRGRVHMYVFVLYRRRRNSRLNYDMLHHKIHRLALIILHYMLTWSYPFSQCCRPWMGALFATNQWG